MSSPFRFPAWLAAAIACVALVSVGCQTDLDGKSWQLSKYDEAKDEYHFFWVCTDIVASRAPIADGKRRLTHEEHRQLGLGHLEGLWKSRENVVLLPGPFGPIAFIRKANRLLETVSLFRRDEEPKQFTTNFDLTPIRVIPGEMFLSPQQTLCYTHHCVFPGKTMDEAFTLVMLAINPEVQKTAQARLDARKNGEQKRTAWKQLRTELWNGVNQGQRYTLASRLLEKFPEALEDASLESIVGQASKQEIKLARQGMRFTVQLKLTPADAKEFCSAMEDALRGELPDPSKGIPAGQLDPYASQKKHEGLANDAFRQSKATCDETGNVSMIVELMPVLQLLGDEGGPWGYIFDSSLSAERLKGAQADAAEIEARKIPVSRKRQVEKLVEEFKGKK